MSETLKTDMHLLSIKICEWGTSGFWPPRNSLR